MNDCGKNCECVHIEPFRTITKNYHGTENDAVETIVDNKARTIEIRLKPQQYASKFAFPNIGNTAVLYIDVKDNETYRWDEEKRQYVCVGADYHQIKIINGGTANYGK